MTRLHVNHGLVGFPSITANFDPTSFALHDDGGLVVEKIRSMVPRGAKPRPSLSTTDGLERLEFALFLRASRVNTNQHHNHDLAADDRAALALPCCSRSQAHGQPRLASRVRFAGHGHG